MIWLVEHVRGYPAGQSNEYMLSFIPVGMKVGKVIFPYHQFMCRWNLYCDFRLFPSNSPTIHINLSAYEAQRSTFHCLFTTTHSLLSDHSRTYHYHYDLCNIFLNCLSRNMVQSKKFRGVRQRQWGSWVSEIRHPLL